MRGCVFEYATRGVAQAVEDTFGFAEMQLVSFADLYAGKAVAALDRQHPRDLFDVLDLLANEGIDHSLRQTFIVYLLSHNRPMSEVLAPRRKDISEEFMHGFDGMTDKPVSVDKLLAGTNRSFQKSLATCRTSTGDFLCLSSEENPTGLSWDCQTSRNYLPFSGDSTISTN